MTEPAPEPNPTAGDTAALIAKRDRLLAELKAARARIAELEGERDGATKRAEGAAAALRRFRLDDPLAEIATGLIDLPEKYAVALLRDHLDFAMNAAGEVEARVKGAKDAIPFTGEAIGAAAEGIPELRARFHKPVGPNAPGGAKPHAQPLPRPEPRKPLAPRLGLR